MSSFIDQLQQEYPAGVYHWPAGLDQVALQAKAEAAGWRLFWIAGTPETVYDKASFLATLAQILAFPAYFGGNWDAFEECVNDLSWVPAKGYLLVLAGMRHFAQNEPAAWVTAIDILQKAAQLGVEESRLLYVLLSAPAEENAEEPWTNE